MITTPFYIYVDNAFSEWSGRYYYAINSGFPFFYYLNIHSNLINSTLRHPEEIDSDECNQGLLNSPSLDIAILGIRGIPAFYGGFETFAENLAERLVKRNHDVTVYGRRDRVGDCSKLGKRKIKLRFFSREELVYKKIRLRILPSISQKYLETPVHTLLSIFDAAFANHDIFLVCNAANSPFIWILRLLGKKVVVNVDGIERKRAKWNFAGRMWYRLGELCSVLFSSCIISDAEVIRKYYKKNFYRDSTVIAYGFQVDDRAVDRILSTSNFGKNLDPEIFNDLEIAPDKYVLYVSRLEPENNAHVVVEAFNKISDLIDPDIKLVIVGDAPYAEEYKAMLLESKTPKIVFAGYKFGDDYRNLQLGAKIYVQATEVGGTHPALVEAMGYGNCIIANSTPENREVLEGSGLFYEFNSKDDLSAQILKILKDEKMLLSMRKAARERASERYSWKIVVDRYESLFLKLTKKKL